MTMDAAATDSGKKNPGRRLRSSLTGRVRGGGEPFRRSAVIISLVLILATIMGFAATNEWVLTVPTSLVDGQKILAWIITTVLVPHLLLYVIGVATALWILPESTVGYSWWLFTEGWRRVALVLLMMQAVVMAAAGLVISQASEGNVTSVASGMSAAQAELWNLALLSMLIPTWIGYRVGWRVYHDAGARTERQRQEDYLQALEIKHSGQFWDKYVTRPWRRATGIDGHKPRWFTMWLILTFVTFLFLYALSMGLSSQYLFGVGVFTAAPSITALMAGWAKYRDGAMTRRLPILIPVRDAEHDEPYDPRSAGIKTFVRS